MTYVSVGAVVAFATLATGVFFLRKAEDEVDRVLLAVGVTAGAVLAGILWPAAVVVGCVYAAARTLKDL